MSSFCWWEVWYSRGIYHISETREGQSKWYQPLPIVNTLEGLGLSLNELWGQGYDGAATMSGEKSGVQKRIWERQPKAVYTHCAGHSLNLVIVSSCSVSPVQNCIYQINSWTLWIKSSPKWGLLKAVYQHGSEQLNLNSSSDSECVHHLLGWKHWWLRTIFSESSFFSSTGWGHHLWQ